MIRIKIAILLLLAQTISINMWVQTYFGNINLVLIAVLLLNIRHYPHFDIYHILIIGLLQDIVSMTPPGWHITLLFAGILLLNHLQNLLLSFTIRNQVILFCLVLGCVQIIKIFGLLLLSRDFALLQQLIEWLLSCGIAFIAISGMNHPAFRDAH